MMQGYFLKHAWNMLNSGIWILASIMKLDFDYLQLYNTHMSDWSMNEIYA